MMTSLDMKHDIIKKKLMGICGHCPLHINHVNQVYVQPIADGVALNLEIFFLDGDLRPLPSTYQSRQSGLWGILRNKRAHLRVVMGWLWLVGSIKL